MPVSLDSEGVGRGVVSEPGLRPLGCRGGTLPGSSPEDLAEMVIIGDAEVQVMGHRGDHQASVCPALTDALNRPKPLSRGWPQEGTSACLEGETLPQDGPGTF